MIDPAVWDALVEALGLRVANRVRDILERTQQDPRETFRRLRAEGYPSGRAKSQRRMAARCRKDARTIRRWLAQGSSEIPT